MQPQTPPVQSNRYLYLLLLWVQSYTGLLLDIFNRMFLSNEIKISMVDRKNDLEIFYHIPTGLITVIVACRFV